MPEASPGSSSTKVFVNSTSSNPRSPPRVVFLAGADSIRDPPPGPPPRARGLPGSQSRVLPPGRPRQTLPGPDRPGENAKPRKRESTKEKGEETDLAHA